MRLLFIHEGNKSEDTIKNFLNDCYELYVKALMNPFVDKNTRIFSTGLCFSVFSVFARVRVVRLSLTI